MKFISITYEYLNELKYSVKQRTYLFYLQIAEIYLSKHFDIDIKDISSEIINEIISNKLINYSSSTLKLIIGLIKRVLIFAYEKGYIQNLIIIKNKIRNKNSKSVQALDKQEQQNLEHYILMNKDFYHYGILVSLYTGLRIGELLSLKWEKVNTKDKLIYIETTTCKISQNHKTIDLVDSPKTNSSIRQIPITPFLNKILSELKNYQQNKSDYVISKSLGKKIDVRTYQSSFERLLKELNIKHYGFHSLRHTFATRLLENNVDIKTISELLGHSSPSITLNRYVHTNLQNKIKALQILTKKSAKHNGWHNIYLHIRWVYYSIHLLKVYTNFKNL